MTNLFEEDNHLLKIYKNMYIRKDAFVALFGENNDYETLINHKNANDKWKSRFKWMKKQGILN